MLRGNVKEFYIMCQVLQRLLRLSENQWRNETDFNGTYLNEVTIKNRESLIQLKDPMRSEDLEKLLNENSDNLCFAFHKPFYLPPLDYDKEFIPILFLECDFRESPPKISLRVGMIRFVNGDIKNPKSFGLRFETGEHHSNHDYFHVQFTIEPFTTTPFKWNLPGCPEGIPQTYPCIPVPAMYVVSLIFCMLISFYGRIIKSKFIPALNINSKYLKPFEFFK